MNKENENLNDLLKTFFNEQGALKAKRDIEAGDQLLSDHPATQPDAIVIDSIKSRISARLNEHTQQRFHTIARRTAVAVVAAVLVMTGIHFNGRKVAQVVDVTGPDKTVLNNIWQEDTAGRTLQQDTLAAQIDEIADSILSIRLDEHTSQQSDGLIDIEAELVETNGDFWKG